MDMLQRNKQDPDVDEEFMKGVAGTAYAGKCSLQIICLAWILTCICTNVQLAQIRSDFSQDLCIESLIQRPLDCFVHAVPVSCLVPLPRCSEESAGGVGPHSGEWSTTRILRSTVFTLYQCYSEGIAQMASRRPARYTHPRNLPPPVYILESNFIHIGLPHNVIKDDEFEGFFIPKGTMLRPNIWFVSSPRNSIRSWVHYRAMLHDPDVYPDPMRFMPERFLTADGKPNTSVRDPSVACFGFGRRFVTLLVFLKTTIW